MGVVGDLAAHDGVADQPYDLVEVREVLLEWDVVDHRLEHTGVFALEEDLEDAERGGLEVAGADGPVGEVVVPASEWPL